MQNLTFVDIRDEEGKQLTSVPGTICSAFVPANRAVRFSKCLFVLLTLVLHGMGRAGAQQKETSVPLSQRMTINLSAGVPQYIGNAASNSNAPQSQWWYEKLEDVRRLCIYYVG